MGKHFKNKKIIGVKGKVGPKETFLDACKDVENIQNEEVTKKFLEKREIKTDEIEKDPDTFTVREYKCRFLKIKAYRLAEDSTIHCADAKTLVGRAGDFYVCLDQVQELVLAPEVFKKMFIIKLDE